MGSERLILEGDFPKVEYHHCPGLDYFSALYFGVKLIETDYVIQIADDDLVLTDGIKKCLEFLVENPSYSGATGHRAFFEEGTGLYYSTNFRGGFLDNISKDFATDSPAKRLNHYFNQNLTVAHHVIRTVCLLDCLKVMKNNNRLCSVNYYEIILLYMTLVKGNFKFLPIMYILRSKDFSVYKDRSFKDERIRMWVDPKYLPIDLFYSKDPLSLELSVIAKKNYTICRLITVFVYVFKFVGARTYSRLIYRKIAGFIYRKIFGRVVESHLSGTNVSTSFLGQISTIICSWKNSLILGQERKEMFDKDEDWNPSRFVEEIIVGPVEGDKQKLQEELDQIGILIREG
jgi:glycosyltransferase domain-containing protein